MAKLQLKVASTSQSLNIFIQDSSSTTGAGLTGLVFNSSGLTAYYALPKAAAVSITLATLAAITTAYSSGGFKEVDATNMPGWYRFDLPDAAIASGRFVSVHLKGVTNMAPLPLEIELTGWDNQDAVHGGLSALPNVASGSAGALLVDGTGTAAISNSSGKVLLQATQSGVTIPTVTTVTNQLTAAQVATGVWQDTTAGDFTTASSIGKSLYTTGNAPGAASGLALVGSNVGSASSVTGAVGSVTGAVGSVTGAVGSVTGSVGSVASGGITNASLAADTGLKPIRSNTAQAGAGTTITLDASASASDNFYNNALILLTGGTGIGQARFISAYVGSTKVATVATWVTNPDNTTTFAILPFDAVAGASAPTTAQIATAVWQDLLASSDFSTASSIGALLKTDIDAAISSRMATFSTPTNFSSLAIDSSGRVNAFLIGILTSVFTEGATGRIAAAFKQFFNIATPAATMDHGVLVDTVTTTTTATTATNLTNAPTAGDFTATMKTSIGTAVAASAVASVTGNVAGSVASVVGAVGSVTGAVGSVAAGVTLTSGERNSVADALLDRTAGVETSFTPRQTLRLILSSVVAKLSGAATTTVTIRDINDTKARITATVDADGNRTAVTTDVT